MVHCNNCHSFVKPELLSKSIWKKDVLLAMGFRRRIYANALQRGDLLEVGESGEMVVQANNFPEQQQLAPEDWRKIIDYYVNVALEIIVEPIKDHKIQIGLNQFKYRESNFSHIPALTSMVKILPNNQGFIFADSKKKPKYPHVLKPDLTENYSNLVTYTPIGFIEKADTLLLTMVGNGLFRTDALQGRLQRYLKKNNRYEFDYTLISYLKMLVATTYDVLNNNGLEDIVICEFGNQIGNLAWFQNLGNGEYKKNILRNLP